MVLRSCLCDYLDSNFAAYIEFLTGDTDNESDRYLRYFLNVEQLRTPGTWSNLLPLALADWSRRTVKIFTSNLYRPVTIVHPQDINNESQCEMTPITVSLLELEAPHYKTVFPLSPKRFTVPAFSDNTSGIQVPESEKTTPDETMIHSSPGTRQASSEQETSTPPATFPPHMETPRKQGTFKTPPSPPPPPPPPPKGIVSAKIGYAKSVEKEFQEGATTWRKGIHFRIGADETFQDGDANWLHKMSLRVQQKFRGEESCFSHFTPWRYTRDKKTSFVARYKRRVPKPSLTKKTSLSPKGER